MKISRDKFSIVLQDIAFNLWQQMCQTNALPVLHNARHILEFGCGAGIFTYCYADAIAPKDWVLCDQMVPADLDIPADATLMIGDLDSMLQSLPEHYYDCVMSNCTLHDIPDCGDAIAKLSKTLMHDGLMTIAVLTDEQHHLDYWYSLCSMFIEILSFESYTIITSDSRGGLTQYQPLIIIGIAK